MKWLEKKWTDGKSVGLVLLAAGAVALGWSGCSRKESGTSSPYGAETRPGPRKSGVVYTCPMHPKVRQDHPGRCPICGMNLVPEDQVKKGGSGMKGGMQGGGMHGGMKGGMQGGAKARSQGRPAGSGR